MGTKQELRSFDAAAWKPGMRVVNRRGQEVRVICVDGNGAQPVVAFVESDTYVEFFYSNGTYFTDQTESGLDLFFADPLPNPLYELASKIVNDKDFNELCATMGATPEWLADARAIVAKERDAND